MSGFIGSPIDDHSLGELSSTVFYQSPLHLPEAPRIRNTATALTAYRLAEVRRTKENSNPSRKLHCVKGTRAQNNLAFMPMLIHSYTGLLGRGGAWPETTKAGINLPSDVAVISFSTSKNCDILFNV